MARDFRNQNNRSKVVTQTQVRRPVTTYKKDTRTLSASKAGGPAAGLRPGANPHGHGKVYGYLTEVVNPKGARYEDRMGGIVGYYVSHGGADYKYYDLDGNQFYETGHDGRWGKYTRNIKNTSYQSFTETSTRYQALDKRSGDPDDQKVRDLKTKRDGRNKLRIQLSGDASAGRLQGGPNSDRKRNKLKIDVQGGGQAGLNVPR